MALTGNFRQTVQARVRRDPEFRNKIARDAVECILIGQIALGIELLRDWIKAIIGNR